MHAMLHDVKKPPRKQKKFFKIQKILNYENCKYFKSPDIGIYKPHVTSYTDKKHQVFQKQRFKWQS